MALFGRPNVEKLKEARNISGLIEALAYKGRDASEVRKAAIEALGELRAARAIEPLLRALEDPDGNIRILAARALSSMDDPRTVEPFIKALHDPSSSVQEQAALALEHLNDQRAVAPLLEALQGRGAQGEIRPADPAIAHAIMTLARDQAEPLIALLRNKKRLAWQEAIGALAKLQDQRAVDVLVEVALDNETTWANRRNALALLETLGWRPTSESHQLVQMIAAQQWEQVERFGASAIEPLIALLRLGEEPIAQQHAMTLLVKLRAARAVGPLVDLVRGIERVSARHPRSQDESASQQLGTQELAVQQSAIQTIETLLEQVALDIPTEGLRKVLLLRDELSAAPPSTPQEREAAARLLFGPESVPMPRVHAKHLAHLELQRRKLNI
jgi:HEAT repeat protein